MRIYNEYEIRSDGRLSNEMKRIQLSHEIIDSNGFISIKQGETHVTGSIGEAKDKSNINFSISFYGGGVKNEGVSERRIFELRSQLSEVFKSLILNGFPVSVDLVVKQDNGGLLCALINTTTLVLCYHGVPLIDMCVSISSGKVLDLNINEQNRELGITLAFLPKKNKIAYLVSEGRAYKKLYIKALESGICGCRSLCKYFEEFLKKINTPYVAQV